MRKSAKILVALGAGGLALAAGSAFTNSNSMPSAPTVGYGTTTVSGATVDSLAYNLDPTGADVASVALVLAGDTTGSSVSLSYNGGNSFTCGTGSATTTGTITTSYTCLTPSGTTQATSGLTSTAVVVN